MSKISPQSISSLNNLQSQIWQTVSLSASETSGLAIQFANPLTMACPSGAFAEDAAGQKVVIEFSFAQNPEHINIVVMSQETFLAIAAKIKGESGITVDDALVAEQSAVLEGMVQGICLALSNFKNDQIVSSGLSTHFGHTTPPLNFEKQEQLLKSTVSVTGEDLSGTVVWYYDANSASFILGEEIIVEDEAFGDVDESFDLGKKSSGSNIDDQKALEILLDIPLEISVELGRAKMLVREIMEFGTGSIIEIDKAAGEPVDVMVNGRVVAKGEVIVIEDNFGVRITEIISAKERIAKLGEIA